MRRKHHPLLGAFGKAQCNPVCHLPYGHTVEQVESQMLPCGLSGCHELFASYDARDQHEAIESVHDAPCEPEAACECKPKGLCRDMQVHQSGCLPSGSQSGSPGSSHRCSNLNLKPETCNLKPET